MNDRLYEVRDLWCAAFCVAHGLELKDMRVGPDGWAKFYFDGREIGPVFIAWVNDTATVNARKLIGAYKYVRSLMYQRMPRP